MQELRRFKLRIESAFRYFERRNFRARVSEEKSKKYLVSKTPAKKSVPLFEFTGRWRFRFVSTIYSKVRNEGDKIRVASAAMAVTLIALSLYLAFGSSYFRISPSKVIIERVDAGSDVNIAYKSIEEFYGAPIFLVDSFDVSKAIVSMQKNIRSAKVERLYPNGLKIVISSWPAEFVTYFPEIDRYYGVTGNGILVYSKTRNPELSEINIIDPDLTEAGFLDYREGVSEEAMTRITSLRKGIREALPWVTIAKFAFFRLEQEVHVFLDSWARLVFSLDGTEKRQLSTLVYWNSQEGWILAKWWVSYVDLRIPARVFVCRDESVCKKNLERIYGQYYAK